MSDKKETKKVTKKMVIVDGKKVPFYMCPPGMSGLGLDLERYFNQQEKEEIEFEINSNEEDIKESFKEDLNFAKSYERYCNEGEITSHEVEDYVYQRQIMRHYDPEKDCEKDLLSIFNI
jgi:hypothetical protein